MDQIQAMRIFTRIVELGSFSRAAERLQLPAPRSAMPLSGWSSASVCACCCAPPVRYR